MKKLLLSLFSLCVIVASLGLEAQQTYREILLHSATRTTTGQTGAISNGGLEVPYLHSGGRLYVRVSAVSGTSPTLIVTLLSDIQGSIYEACRTGTITAVGEYTCEAGYLSPTSRAGYIITGTSPSFTFTAYLVRY